MTQEDKELLLKDLSTRLLYGVIINTPNGDGHLCSINQTIFGNEYGINISATKRDYFNDNECDIKPYLRPMSSMTEEEKEDLKSKCTHTETEEDWEGVRCDVWGIQILDKYDTRRWDNPIWPSTINMNAIDWLNAHHFDYQGLIEKGFALEAPEGMYNIKEK